MLCDRCKKEEACLHIRGIDQEGKVRSLNLCARCAIEEISRNGAGVDDRFLEAVRQAAQNMGPEILELLQKNMARLAGGEDKESTCTACGRKKQDFLEDHLLGCRQCFQSFYKNIRHILDSQFDYQSIRCGEKENFRSAAEAAPAAGTLDLLEENIQQLRKEMDLAARREEYELAGKLKDQIQACSRKLAAGLEQQKGLPVPDGSGEVVDEYSSGLFENHRLPWLPRHRRTSPVIVLSSFVTAERNLENLEIPPFVNHYQDAEESVQKLQTALESETLLGRMRIYNPDDMDRDGLTSLYEHGWCEADFFLRAHPRRIIVSENERIVCLLNDRNHFQMTFWGEAGEFPRMLPAVQQMMTGLSGKVTFWMHESDGYVTRDIRHAGTGIRMGGIIFLPALSIAKAVNQVANGCKALGVTLQPLFSGPNEKNALYVFYNSSSRNASPEEIAQHVRKVQDFLVRHEQECRSSILLNDRLRLKLCDLIGRAWGIVGEARMLAPAEGRSLLSLIWLGMEYGMLPRVTMDKIFQGFCDLAFYDMKALKKRLLPDGVCIEKILASRFRHDIAGHPSGE